MINTVNCYFAFHKLINKKQVARYLYENTHLYEFYLKVSYFAPYDELSDYNVFKFSFRFKPPYKEDEILDTLHQALYLSPFKFIKL